MKSSTPNGKRLAENASATHQASLPTLPTTPLPDQIGQNIEAIVALQTKARRDLPRHQRAVESVTAFFSRPAVRPTAV